MKSEIAVQFKDNIRVLVEAGKLDEAKKLLEKYREIDKDDIEIYSIMGVIAMMEGDMCGAERYLKKGLDIDNTNFDLTYNLGYLYEEIGSITQSLYFYKRAVVLCNDKKLRLEMEDTIRNIVGEDDFQLEVINNFLKDSHVINKVLFVQCIPDIRTNKIAQIIHNKGIQVDIMYLSMHPKDVYKGLKLPYKNIFKIETINTVIKFINKSDYDIIFSCNEPDYLSALFTSTNKPIIHDCHDMMSLRSDISNDQIILEYIANCNSEGNIYVTNSVKKVAMSKFDLGNKPVMILDNYILKNQIPKNYIKKLSDQDGEIHCVYEGGLSNIEGHHRNIENIFMKLAQQKIHVHIYTSFENSYYNGLDKRSKYIHYEGTKAPNELIKEMTKYDIGLTILNVTNRNKRFLDTTFPNKAWEYLAAGLPILFSDLASFRGFLENNNVGEIINIDSNLRAQIERVKTIKVVNNYLELNRLCMDDFADRLVEFLIEVKGRKMLNKPEDKNLTRFLTR